MYIYIYIIYFSRAPRKKVNNLTASQRRQLMAETKNRSFNRSGYDTSTRKQVNDNVYVSNLYSI